MKNISQPNRNPHFCNDNISVKGLIITAGFSSRMKTFKPLMQYDGKTFIHNIAYKLDSVCDEIVVITGYNRDLIESELNSISTKKIKPIFNINYKSGMFSSLQTGLEYLKNSRWVIYHFVDQPNLPPNFYKEFIKQLDTSIDWIQPRYNGRNGHPILLSNKLIELILKAPQNSNLKELTNNSNIAKKYWECNFPEIHDDIDTIERYNKLSQ